MTYGFTYQMRWIWAFTKGYRTRLTLFVVLEIIVVVLSLTFIYWSKRSIDISLKATDGNLRFALFMVVGSILLSVLIQLWSSWLNGHIRTSMNIQLQNSLTNKQMVSAWKYIKQWHTGDILVRLNTDCHDVVQMVVYSGPTFIVTLIRLVASLGFLWVMDPMLVWIIIGISPLFLFSKIYFRRMRKLNQDMKQAESNLGNVMQENLKLRMLIRGLGLVSFRQRKLEESQASIFDLRMKQLNFSLFAQGVMKVTMNAGYLLTFIWGVYRLHHGQISFGTMTAFLQLVGRVQPPLLSIMTFVPAFIRFRTSVDRVLAFYEAEDEKEQEDNSTVVDLEAIHIEEITFRYEDDVIIDSLNLYIKKGEPVAVIGSSGKGKTTLIRLLLSLIRPNEGGIYLETSNGREPLTAGHRVNFAYVPQGNTIFSGTVRENLTMEVGNINDDHIHHVLKTACAEFVHDLPNGLDTEIGESGHGLSEGQAQRIAIARAILRESSVWVFDEATSALDEVTSSRLIEQLMHEGRNKILIFVTHDLRLAERCRQTVYMH